MSKLKLLLLANYLNTFGWVLYSPLYALFVLKIGGSAIDVSLIWSVYALLTGLLIMTFGRLENSVKFNPAIMLFVGYSLFIIVATGYYYVDTVGQFYCMQIVLALAMGIMTPAAKATYMRAEHAGKEAGEWGMFDGGNYIIGAAASFAGGMLFKLGDFKLIFIVMALIQILASAFAYTHWRKNLVRTVEQRSIV